MTRRQGEYLYGVASCTAALQSKRRKVYTIYQKQGFLERKAASKRLVMSGLYLSPSLSLTLIQSSSWSGESAQDCGGIEGGLEVGGY